MSAELQQPRLRIDDIDREIVAVQVGDIQAGLVGPDSGFETGGMFGVVIVDRLNQGSNHFSFNPYWAATVFLGPKATVSWRLHYLWSDTNDEFTFGGKMPSDVDLEPGDAVHANFAAAYEVLPKQLRLGINGYWFDQISDTKVDGRKDKSMEEKVVAIGPGAVWHFSQDTHLFVNAYFETDAESRPEGERFNLRYVHHF